MNNIQKANHAYESGVRYAKAIKVGDLFLGAGPEAVKAGFVNGDDVSSFVAGALDTFESAKMSIVTDLNNLVTARASLWK